MAIIKIDTHTRNTEAGTFDGQPTYCTCNDWTCPYYVKGVCHIEDPVADCDDFGSWFADWDEWLASE